MTAFRRRWTYVGMWKPEPEAEIRRWRAATLRRPTIHIAIRPTPIVAVSSKPTLTTLKSSSVLHTFVPVVLFTYLNVVNVIIILFAPLCFLCHLVGLIFA